MFLIFNPHSQSITSSINCRRLDQEGQSVKAWSICRSRLCVGPEERPKRKTATMKVMIPAALLHLPGLSCLNRYHLSPVVKERRNYWVTGLVSLPKCLKASKWHFLSKGQGWHRLISRVADTSNQHVQMPGLKCQSLLVPGRAWCLLRVLTICFPCHFANKSSQARCGKGKQDQLDINVITLGRRRCRTTCRRESVSLKSPAADRQNTIRL